MSPPPPLSKTAFITVGATASFKSLLEYVLSPPLLSAFASKSYTRLVLQCGPSLEFVRAFVVKLREMLDRLGLEVEAFDYKPEGLREEMLRVKARPGVSELGVVVTHAGEFGRPVRREII